MIVDVSKVPDQGMSLEGSDPGDILEFGPQDEFRAAGPVFYDFYVQVVDGLLIVRGSVSAELEAHCARCTQIFSTTAADSGFLRDFPVPQGAEKVDVTADLREAILLNLPRFPVCDEACRGLCPGCGKDLNKGECECGGTAEEGPWAGLNNLKI